MLVLVPRQRMPNATSTATIPLSCRIARSMRIRASVDCFDPNRRTQAPWTNHKWTCCWSMLLNQFTTVVPDGPDWEREGSGSSFPFPSETSPFQKETLEGRHVAESWDEIQLEAGWRRWRKHAVSRACTLPLRPKEAPARTFTKL